MKIKSLIPSLCLLGVLSIPATAMAAPTGSSSPESLQKQITELRHEVAALKNSKRHYRVHSSKKNASVAATAEDGYPPRSQSDLLTQAFIKTLPLDWDNPGESFVSIGPYVNVPVMFSGNNLIINDPKINTDVALLKLRKAAHEGMLAKGIHTEEETHHSHLLLSGFLEGTAQYINHGQQGENSGSGSSSNIDLSAAELDGFLLTPSAWVSGFFSFNYNNNANATITNSRVLNSNLFLNNAFIVFGDFTKSPFYGNIGQMFVPFGTYSSVFVSSPLTTTIGRTKARAILVGYQGQTPNSFYTAAYTFMGDSHASSTSRVNNGGINLGYKFDIPSPDVNGDIGIGWIANIADSLGMQYTNNQPAFNGFGGPNPYGAEKIVHRVPALDVRGIVSFGTHIDLIGEYIGATTSFNPNDLQFNASGAKPWAVNTEASYTFQTFDRPSAAGIGYSQAFEALALGLPAKRFGLVFNTSIWRNTVQSVEFRHDINYALSTTGTGSKVSPAYKGLGTSDNVVTAQFDLFF